MAQSFVVTKNSITGAERTVMGIATLGDGGAGSSFATGLELVLGAAVHGKSATSTLNKIILNSNVNGDLKLATAASGDDFYVTVWGN